ANGMTFSVPPTVDSYIWIQSSNVLSWKDITFNGYAVCLQRLQDSAGKITTEIDEGPLYDNKELCNYCCLCGSFAEECCRVSKRKMYRNTNAKCKHYKWLNRWHEVELSDQTSVQSLGNIHWKVHKRFNSASLSTAGGSSYFPEGDQDVTLSHSLY